MCLFPGAGYTLSGAKELLFHAETWADWLVQGTLPSSTPGWLDCQGSGGRWASSSSEITHMYFKQGGFGGEWGRQTKCPKIQRSGSYDRDNDRLGDHRTLCAFRGARAEALPSPTCSSSPLHPTSHPLPSALCCPYRILHEELQTQPPQALMQVRRGLPVLPPAVLQALRGQRAPRGWDRGGQGGMPRSGVRQGETGSHPKWGGQLQTIEGLLVPLLAWTLIPIEIP